MIIILIALLGIITAVYGIIESILDKDYVWLFIAIGSIFYFSYMIYKEIKKEKKTK